MQLHRRRTLQAGAGCAARHLDPRQVRVTQHPVSWRRARWPGEHRVRVTQISDLHVGMGTSAALLAAAADAVWRTRPDLVVLTGDYLNRSLTHLGALRAFVAGLPRPCVATLGNHDHWSGARAITAALESAGVAVLANRSMTVMAGAAPLSVVGVDDGYTGHDDVERAFAGVGHRDRALVLSHFPETAHEIVERGGRLVLSGHTHGGHLRVPLVTTLVTRLVGTRYVSGWYEIGDGRLYVNAGIGSSWVRLRAGAGTAPEVAVFDLIA